MLNNLVMIVLISGAFMLQSYFVNKKAGSRLLKDISFVFFSLSYYLSAAAWVLILSTALFSISGNIK